MVSIVFYTVLPLPIPMSWRFTVGIIFYEEIMTITVNLQV